MSPEFITHLILEYRYWILVPLSLVEGPVVAFVAGTLAALDYFNLYLLAIFFFIRDVGLDLVYYALGYFGGKTGFAQRMTRKIGITPEHLGDVHDLWTKRPGWTMLIGKLSYGIASAFIVVAGMVHMPLSKFLFYGSLVAILQYWGLLFLGYFLGESFGGTIVKWLENIQYVLLFSAVVMVAYYFITMHMRKRFLKEDKEIGQGGGTLS